MPALAWLVVAYLAGSIPFAYVAGRLRGIDLRQHGSGNLGATNVYRVLGWKVAVVVVAADVAKGAIPAWLFPHWTHSAYAAHWAIAYGVAAILGHVRSAFLLWRGGGKGVATATGVFLALASVPTLVAVAVWTAVLAASGYVSLASLCAAVLLPVAIVVTAGWRAPVFAASVVVALFVVWTHRANIGRLRRGEEHRFGRKSPAL